MTTKQKRISPYTRLLNQIQQFIADNIKYSHRKLMWRYTKKTLNSGWDLTQLWERVRAADQLGYDVKLVANDSGLEVIYVKKINIPYEWD